MDIIVKNSQKAKTKSTIWPRYITPLHLSLGVTMLLHRFLLISVLLTIGRKWKQSKYPTTYGLIKKMWFVFTMESLKKVES